MTPEVIVAIVAAFFSGLATVLALLSYLNSRKASRVSTELLIQQLISDTRKDTNEFMYAISGENKDAIAKQLLASYIERELNTEKQPVKKRITITSNNKCLYCFFISITSLKKFYFF